MLTRLLGDSVEKLAGDSALGEEVDGRGYASAVVLVV